MKRFLVYLLAIFIFTQTNAAVDTIRVYSNTMKKNIPVSVIRPASYDSMKEFAVVYLLHGYSGNNLDWIKKAQGFEKNADKYNVLIVCPDGGYNSWYWNSPVDQNSQYETFISKELIQSIDSKYTTIKNRNGRAITGLSMGGHGALYLAFRHQDVFGAAGSMSGGVDIRPFPENWDIALKLGTYAEQPDRWEKNTVIYMLNLLSPNKLAIIIDCGKEDFFYEVNENLHRQLMYRNIPHDYITRPGAHNWNYWTNAIKYQLLFFTNYFESARLTGSDNMNK